MSAEYVALRVNALEDDRMIEVSALARYAYIAGLLVAKRNESDGRLTRAQIGRACSDVEDLDARIAELVDIGLWRQVDDRTYLIVSWLKHNKSAADLQKRREQFAALGRKGGQSKTAGAGGSQVPRDTPSDTLATRLATRLTTTLKRVVKLKRQDLKRRELKLATTRSVLRLGASIQALPPMTPVCRQSSMASQKERPPGRLRAIAAATRLPSPES